MPSKTHTFTALALATGALLTAPASSLAADTFGSRLLNEPANASECPGTCTIVSYIHPSDPNGDPYAGGSPVDGVITSYKVRAKPYVGTDPVLVTPRVADITRQGSDIATARATASGQQVQLAATGAIEEHPTRLPVARGQHLALDGRNAQLTYNAGGDKFSFVFNAPLAGDEQRMSFQARGELLIQARVEADRDRDGLGDETQDGCPSQASTTGQCDRTAPRVSSMRLRKGRLAYRLSEAGRVQVTVQKRRKGRWIRAKRASMAGKAGANALSFRKQLGKGRYRVTAVATDGNANKSRTYAKKFRFKK